MLRLSQAGDYAIRGMVHMVSSPAGNIFLVREIAENCSIPRPFLAKIFQTLARNGVLKSHQGSGGGFSLSRPAEAITLLEIVQAIEGKIILHDSILKEDRSLCETDEEFTLGKIWRQAQQAMTNILEDTNLTMMSSSPHESQIIKK